ncbi:hypothetical protein [Rhodococcus sp. P1Y]|uniref:hypothetical protein n=1 Tax=Rhodococcus sp. P1Y TaxID=1302308 RepID=UPI00129379EA|nr:hypothetical protein [Rhodococcus sp. P1Y]
MSTQDENAWTMAEENWKAAVLAEITRRIEEGQYVPDSLKSPFLRGSTADPYNPDILTKSQLEDHLADAEKIDTTDKLEFYAATFRVPNPHS